MIMEMASLGRASSLAALTLLCGILAAEPAAATEHKRFFTDGDGTIAIRSTKNKHRFRGRFRTRHGTYLRKALRQINGVFGGSLTRPETRISLRLIEVLSHLRLELDGGWITISSGFRSSRYNQKLRKRGRTVAKASLHLYGMAADVKISGVNAKRLWEFAREHKVGGAGFYGGPWVHIDVGPARSWTQGTANVRAGKSDHNKRIILVPEYDIYAAGEEMRLRFARMTAFPIGVEARGFTLHRKTGSKWKEIAAVSPRFGGALPAGCALFRNTSEMLGVTWPLPKHLAQGRYRIGVTFCESVWEAMPPEIASYEFRVRRR